MCLIYDIIQPTINEEDYVKMISKEDALKQTGSFNHNFEHVAAGIFNAASFFDRRDIVQVKYEMIRAASNAEGSITDISDAYGFSRKSYYQILKAFQAGGLCGLIPQKTGPKNPHKLKPEATAFIDSFLDNNTKAKPKEISAALEAEMGINIHPRSIYRYLKKTDHCSTMQGARHSRPYCRGL